VKSCEDNRKGIEDSRKKSFFEIGQGENLQSDGDARFIGTTIKETGEEGKGARLEIMVPKDKYRFV